MYVRTAYISIKDYYVSQAPSSWAVALIYYPHMCRRIKTSMLSDKGMSYVFPILLRNLL